MAAASSPGSAVWHRCSVRLQCPAPSVESAIFLCDGPQLRVWDSFLHHLRASAIDFVRPFQFETTGQREVILGANCESCT